MNAIEIAPLLGHDRAEHVFETGLSYDGLRPLRLRVTKRADRLEFSDDGGAVDAAAVDPVAATFDREIDMGAHSVNVSGRGVVSLPARAGAPAAWLALVAELVAAGSLVLYESLLALDD